MKRDEYLKLELMLFAINSDFFGYGSDWKKLSNGQYKVQVDGEIFYQTAQSLIHEFDNLTNDQKHDIIEFYYEKELYDPNKD